MSELAEALGDIRALRQRVAGEWEQFCAAIQSGPPVCDCCKRRVPYVRGSMWHGKSKICLACFCVWYEPSGPIDSTDPAQVAAEVLQAEAAGTYPFGRDDAQYRRIA